MKLSEYIKSLDSTGLESYAQRCNTSPAYIASHIFYARKEPRKALREALARESQGRVSLQEVLDHFGMSADSDRAA